MEKHIEEMKNHTDLNPWYWISYGDGEYAFAVVEAITLNKNDPIPPPGSELIMEEDGGWCGENGSKMIIESNISSIERQNGDVICRFIAAAHTHFLKDELSTL